MRDYKRNINTIIDLEAGYDCQLPNLGLIIEESVVVDRKYIKLIAKVLPIINYYVYISFRISKQSYSSKEEEMASIEQGNIILGNICYEKLCFVIKRVLNLKYRALIQVPIRILSVRR